LSVAGIRPILMECAAHEVGHGLCWDAGGFPIGTMVVRVGWFGGVCDAYVKCRDERLRERLDERTIDAYLIGLAGGAAGQIRYLTEQGRRWGARSRADGNAGWDRSEFRRLGPAHGSRLSWSRAVELAGRIISSRSDCHDRLTIELARTGRLSGGAL
jgi:hypothetical protein